jgi:hypothetical protein
VKLLLGLSNIFKFSLLSTVAFVPFFHFNANAAIDFQDAIFPELATSGRALAMGNAFIAKVDDSSAPFYNPAGLGTVRYGHLHLSNMHIETNKGWMDMGTKGAGTDLASNLLKSYTLDGTRQLLVDNPGKISHSRFHFTPNFTIRYFSIGYLLSIRNRATIGTEATSQFEYAVRRDHGPYAALNISLFGGVLKFGAMGIILSRIEAFGEVDKDTTIDLQSGDYNKGEAFIGVTGARLTLPIALLPTFAAKYNNAFENEFTARAAGAPAVIKKSLDLGFSITPQIAKIVRIHLEVNWKDFTGEYSDISTNRKIALGGEIDFSRSFFLRFGYGDGWGSGGLGIRSKYLEFDLTSYAVDTTTSEFRGAEDRRFSMTLSSGF